LKIILRVENEIHGDYHQNVEILAFFSNTGIGVVFKACMEAMSKIKGILLCVFQNVIEL
jgi:hypothetical protein